MSAASSAKLVLDTEFLLRSFAAARSSGDISSGAIASTVSGIGSGVSSFGVIVASAAGNSSFAAVFAGAGSSAGVSTRALVVAGEPSGGRRVTGPKPPSATPGWRKPWPAPSGT